MADRPEIPSGTRPETSEEEGQWRTAGDRIPTLLDSCAASGAAAYERAQQLVREVVGLYGAGLERIVQLAPDLAERLGGGAPVGVPLPSLWPPPRHATP